MPRIKAIQKKVITHESVRHDEGSIFACYFIRMDHPVSKVRVHPFIQYDDRKQNISPLHGAVIHYSISDHTIYNACDYVNEPFGVIRHGKIPHYIIELKEVKKQFYLTLRISTNIHLNTRLTLSVEMDITMLKNLTSANLVKNVIDEQPLGDQNIANLINSYNR